MKINLIQGKIKDLRTEAIILPLFENEQKLAGEAKELDDALGGFISQTILAKKDFEGKLNDILYFYTQNRIKSPRIILTGLGKRKEFELDRLCQAVGSAVKTLIKLKIKDAIILSPQTDQEGLTAITEAAILASYQFSEHKSKKEDFEIQEISLYVPGESEVSSGLQDAVKRARIVARAANFARDLSNHPSNLATPKMLAGKAQELADRFERVKCQIFGPKQMEKMKMGAILGVARGSEEEPRLIVLEYRPIDNSKNPIVVVGKGITFDSGGISLKPSEKLEEMKHDMSGGAAVLGIIKAAAALELDRSIIGIIPVTENLPSGRALKPGDIVRSASGKTIEVVNTDAEGRLILADALNYGLKYNPEVIIDLATLTGACVIALGEEASGLFGNDEKLIEKMKKAGEQTGEKVWPMPIYPAYKEEMKSKVADLRNVGNGREAGACTAAAFLSKFVGQTPWLHLDIAGTAWTSKEKPYLGYGATGIGVRLLMEFISPLKTARRF